MTPDIERLAKEAGFTIAERMAFEDAGERVLSKFAALIAEECAKVGDECAAQPHWTLMQRLAAESIADSIRQEFPAPKGEA